MDESHACVCGGGGCGCGGNPKPAQGPVNRKMTMGEIVSKYPQSIPVIQAAGLHCIGCGVSYIENLEQGCLSHGMSEADILELLDKVNEAVTATPSAPQPVSVSPLASEKLKELLASDNKVEWGYRILVSSNGGAQSYEMDFEKEPRPTDLVFWEQGLKLIIDSAAMDKVEGAFIDYIEAGPNQGFSIRNPGASGKGVHSHGGQCGCGH